MKQDNISLLVLLQEVINEIGDLNNIKGFNYVLTKDGGRFSIQIDEKPVRVNVKIKETDVPNDTFNLPPIIKPESKTIYNLGFDIEGNDQQFQKTNLSLLIRVMKTVVDITTNLIKNYNNSIFVILATSKTGKGFNDPQKIKLYKLLLQNHLPSGYRSGDFEFIDNQEIFLTKI